MISGANISAAAGGIGLVLAYVRWTSLESIMIRGIGQTDTLGVVMFVIGGMLLFFGAIFSMLYAPPAPVTAIACPKCSGSNVEGDLTCRYCGAELAANLQTSETPSDKNSEPRVSSGASGDAGGNLAEQLQKLAELRLAGALSDEEFSRAKAMLFR
jgi:hypothetical protein